MGVEIDAKLVFGIVLTYIDIINVLRKFCPNEENDNTLIESFQDGNINISVQYKSLYLGLLYPYEDSDCEDWTYYVGIKLDDQLNERSTTDSLDIEELKKLMAYDKDDLTKFLIDNNLEVEEPTLMAIPHVW